MWLRTESCICGVRHFIVWQQGPEHFWMFRRGDATIEWVLASNVGPPTRENCRGLWRYPGPYHEGHIDFSDLVKSSVAWYQLKENPIPFMLMVQL